MKYIPGYRLLRKANQGLKGRKSFRVVVTLAYIVKQNIWELTVLYNCSLIKKVVKL